MKINKNQISIYALAYFMLYSSAGVAQVVSKASQDLFVVGNESINLRSEITNSEYVLYVSLPESYDRDSDRQYPVYYALDGNRTFGTTTHVYSGLLNDGFAPETIIVGITYSGSKTNPNLNRSRDLTPTKIERISTSGGASKFLELLANELIPFIDNRYRTDPNNRTLAGTSFAGLFTHYVLFTRPALFNNYIINNPTFWWDEGYSYHLEETFYQSNKSLEVKVIYLCGEFDAIQEVTQMVEQILGRNYNQMIMGFHEIEKMAHLGGEAEAINQGMRFVYERPVITIPGNELLEYCGTYQDGNYVRKIIIKDGELHLVREGASEGVKISAVSKSEFALLGRYFDFHFNRNENGEVIGFSSQRGTDPSRTRTTVKVN